MNSFKKFHKWKVQSTLAMFNQFKVMSAKDTDRGCVIHAKSDDVEITIDDEQIKLLKNFLNYIFKDVKYALSKQ